MRRELLLGLALGLVILAAVFLLPFSSVINTEGSAVDSLYSITAYFLANSSLILSLSVSSLAAIAILSLMGGALVILAALLGLRPLASGVLGSAGMVLATVAGALSPGFTPNLTYGAGYFVIWILVLAQLAVALWKRRRALLRKNTPPASP